MTGYRTATGAVSRMTSSRLIDSAAEPADMCLHLMDITDISLATSNNKMSFSGFILFYPSIITINNK